MAIMWYSTDGPRPHTQRGPGIRLTLAELSAIFAKDELCYVGTEAPSINPDTPSHSVKNVVVELDEGDSFNKRMPKAGFYLVIGVRPNDTDKRLQEYQAKAIPQ